MRENSGWDNWKMDIIAFHECDNLLGAKIQEQKYYEEYKATLNSIEPLPKPKPKIIKNVVKNTLMSTNAKEFFCNTCYFTCRKESEWKRHIVTRKHNNRTKLNEIEQKEPPKNMLVFQCECGKSYNARNSLWYHKKKCSIIQKKETTNIIISEQPTPQDKTDMTQNLLESIMLKNQEFMTELVNNLTNSNQNLVNKIIEILPNTGNNSHDLSSK